MHVFPSFAVFSVEFLFHKVLIITLPLVYVEMVGVFFPHRPSAMIILQSHVKYLLCNVEFWCPFQLVRIATPEFGVSKMPICLEPSLLPTHLPKMPFPVWCFLQDLGVAAEFLAYSWLSSRISTTSPITDTIFSSDLVYKAVGIHVSAYT